MTTFRFWLGLLGCLLFGGASGPAAAADFTPEVSAARTGLVFECLNEKQREEVAADMTRLLSKFGWGVDQVSIRKLENTSLAYVLNVGETDTRHLYQRRDLKIPEFESILVGGEKRDLVSQQEVIAAMMTPGRESLFGGKDCSVAKLLESVGIRQNIAHWSKSRALEFPENEKAALSPTHWTKDLRLKPGVSACEAVNQAFVGKFPSKLGCTNSCAIVYVQGTLDYFERRMGDSASTRLVERKLGADPLADVIPEIELGQRVVKPGRLAARQFNVPWDHWIPGDWGFIRNDDADSSDLSGYEGANIIYSGRGKFGGYYREAADRTLDECLARVYRWRAESERTGEAEDLLPTLRRDPGDLRYGGGLLRDVRDVPVAHAEEGSATSALLMAR